MLEKGETVNNPQERIVAHELKVPSGRLFTEFDLELIRGAGEVGFIQWYDEIRTLVSGKKSHVYVEGREETTQNPRFLQLACKKILFDTKEFMDEEADFRHPRFIGIPTVANGWTPAITMVDRYETITGREACHAVMRSELKAHGGRKGKWVAATIDPILFRDILFDNVVTLSDSKKIAGNRMIEDGWTYADLDGMVFVDRQQGGLAAMECLGFRRIHACYLLLDITYAFQQMAIWPSHATERVEQEIGENQITFS